MVYALSLKNPFRRAYTLRRASVLLRSTFPPGRLIWLSLSVIRRRSESDTETRPNRGTTLHATGRGYAPSRSRTREASTGARGPGSVLSIVLSIELVRRRLPEPRGGAALSLQYRYRNAASSLVELLALRLIGLHFSIGPIINARASLASAGGGAQAVSADAPMTARRRGHGARHAAPVPPAPSRPRHRPPVPHAPSRRAPAGPATVRRVLMGSCRATAVTPCACRIAIGMARTARRSAFDVRSTL